MKSSRVALLVTAMSLSASVALAAGYFTNGVPPAGGTQYPGTVPLTGNETIPADTNLLAGANPASEAISTALLQQYAGASGPNNVNLLIGGDAGTNLWQRGTTGASQTTPVTYGGPDRWAYWSGSATAMTVSRDTTAGDLPSAYQAAFKMARTSGQTGVLPICMAQEIATQVAIAAAGQTVELDFHAFTGANFSAASVNMTAYIITGTGTDEGMSKLAWGLNTGGGGSTAWTGQANATAAVTSLQAVSTLGRYVAVANIPAAATEIGVALCYTPVGTAGTNDYVAFSGVQLKRSPGLASSVSATLGYNALAIQASSFQRRLPADEQVLQQQYYYQITEATGPSALAMCRSHSVTVAECFVQFPVTMRAVPTMTYVAGFATETTAAGGTLGACSALATSTTVAAVAATSGILVACTATTVPAAGVAGVLYNNGASGAIKASAEL